MSEALCDMGVDLGEAAVDAATTMGAPLPVTPSIRSVEPMRRHTAPPRLVRLTRNGLRQPARSLICQWYVPHHGASAPYRLNYEAADECLRLLDAQCATSLSAHDRPRTRVMWPSEWLTPVPRTPLGERLRALRRRIVASGRPLLDWDGLESELRSRRSRDVPGEPG
ncbi:MAG: hypothetical protein HUU22_08120 [Phycisphaerae bacterium]|nr:hypothetical protein [Phycisphaerae bacterium]